jgi:hypothetical protein
MFGWRVVWLLAAGFGVATTFLVLAADAQVDAKADPKADPKAEAKSAVKIEPKTDPKAATKTEIKAEAKAGAKADVKADAKSDAKAKASGQTVSERVAVWLKTCLQDWDTATHMSKEQWRATCERVSKERGKFLNETPESLSLPNRR